MVDKYSLVRYLMFISRGVIAKRLGSGLQNRLDRFDSDSRLHFLCLFSEKCSENCFDTNGKIPLQNKFCRHFPVCLTALPDCRTGNRNSHFTDGCLSLQKISLRTQKRPRRSCCALDGFSRFSRDHALRHSKARRSASARFMPASKVV